MTTPSTTAAATRTTPASGSDAARAKQSLGSRIAACAAWAA